MIEFYTARQIMFDNIQSCLTTEAIPLNVALHRITSESVLSPLSLPPFDNSSMDGYAVVTPATGKLQLVGTSSAGHPYQGTLLTGQTVRILTGAMIPDGADAVVPQEQVTYLEHGITLQIPVKTGNCIRRTGMDVVRKDILIAKGELLQASHIGLLASAGIATINCYAKISLALFSTGDELRRHGQKLHLGEIYESNLALLESLTTSPRHKIVISKILPDKPDVISEHLQKASKVADAILVSGGMSVGDTDFVIKLLRDKGHIEFWKVAMKPGKPFAFGTLGKSWFFGLPGNPVSTFVCYTQLIRPSLDKLSGTKPVEPVYLPAKLDGVVQKSPDRIDFQRGYMHFDNAKTVIVRATGQQDSNRLSSLSQANCFIVLDQDRGNVASGETVLVQPFN